MKGLMSGYYVNSDFPYSTDHFYIRLNEVLDKTEGEYNWQVEFAAVTNTGDWVGVIDTVDWDITSILPDSQDHLRTFTAKLPSDDNYRILMRFINPLESLGYSKTMQLRFANELQDYDRDGWLTLGYVSPTDSTVAVTGISIDTASKFVQIHPNPASDILNFKFSESVSEKKISFYNPLGQLLFSETTCDSNPGINIMELSSEEILIVKVISGTDLASFKVIMMK